MTSNHRLVIFDMDGTLTRPHLDFDRIRREIGVEEPILDAMDKMAATARARAEAILLRHEAEAASQSELQPGASDVVSALRSNGAAVALMTRNSRKSAQALRSRHGLAFDLVWTREDGATKPSPEPVFAICRALGAAPDQAWTVGDYHYDIICGKAAGATTVLFLGDGVQRLEWADEADHVIHELSDLPALVAEGMKCEG